MTIPTFNELFQSVSADIRNRLQVSTIIGKLVLNAFALVQSAKLKLFYLKLGFIYKNIFPDTADPESLQGTLNRFGYVKLKRYQNAATAGEYSVEVLGQVGAVIAPNTTFKSLDTSSSPDYLFVLDTTFTFTATTGAITLRALTPGVESRLIIGDELQVTQPIANVDSYCEVLGITTEPIDAESVSNYRAQTLEAYRTEPQGGSKTDFRRWAKDVAGLREVYIVTVEAGIINIYAEALPENSTDGYGTATATMLATSIPTALTTDPDTSIPVDNRGRRPMGLYSWNISSVTVIPVDITITGLSDSSYLSAISDAIEAHLYNVRPYIAGADSPNDINKGWLYSADIYNIVRSIIIPFATFDTIELSVNSVVVDNYTFVAPEIPYLNSVT